MIVIGTAGWSIPRGSAGHFEGEGTHLGRYSRVLGGVEINSSFYRSHSAQTYAKWAAATPASFRFAVKFPQVITHECRLRRTRRPLCSFLNEIAGLGKRLGPLLVQLPPSLEFEPRAIHGFFALLRDLYDGVVVCEPRHPSWFSDRADALLDAQQVGRVAADPALTAAASDPGGWAGIVYYRLHGSPRKYWSVYEPELIRARAASLVRAAAKECWCVFDNTAGSGAIENALQMAHLVRASPERNRRRA